MNPFKRLFRRLFRNYIEEAALEEKMEEVRDKAIIWQANLLKTEPGTISAEDLQIEILCAQCGRSFGLPLPAPDCATLIMCPGCMNISELTGYVVSDREVYRTDDLKSVDESQ